MGQTLKKLADADIAGRTIFNHRFVVEVCEKVHVHYRNLRILMSERDFREMAQGMSDALRRWIARGDGLTPGEDVHVELCRKEIAKAPVDDSKIKINLNKNLYNSHEDKIFSEGAGFEEPFYVHVKIRDLRLEMSIDEFNQLADEFESARKVLNSREEVNA